MEVVCHIVCVAILILVAVNETIVCLDDDYCDPDLCPVGVQHVACGAKFQLAPTCPSGSKLIEPNMQLQEYILNDINEKRNFIAGGFDSNHSPACRMATIQWDDELATLAAITAAQCTFAYDSCHNTKTFPFSGQLLSWAAFISHANDKKMFEKAINKWYAEVGNSNMSFINSFRGYNLEPDVSHFAFLMLEHNIRIGCGASHFSLLYGNYRSYLIVCNLGYNIDVGEPVYKSCQNAGSQCKTGKNLEYPNLCRISEEYKEESTSQPEPTPEEISKLTPNTSTKTTAKPKTTGKPKTIAKPNITGKLKTTGKPKTTPTPRTTPTPKTTSKSKNNSKKKNKKPKPTSKPKPKPKKEHVSLPARVVGGLVNFIS